MLSDSRRGDPDGPLPAAVDPSFLLSFLINPGGAASCRER
jgi:hypothetical protein